MEGDPLSIRNKEQKNTKHKAENEVQCSQIYFSAINNECGLYSLIFSQEHIDATEARHSNFASSPKIARLDKPLRLVRSKIEYDRPGMSNGLERHSVFCYLAVHGSVWHCYVQAAVMYLSHHQSMPCVHRSFLS